MRHGTRIEHVIGALIPGAVVVLLRYSGFEAEIITNHPLWTLFLMGLTCALVMRSWWSIPIAPVSLTVAVWLLYLISSDRSDAFEDSDVNWSIASFLMFWLLVVVVPTAIGGAIGSFISMYLWPGGER